VKGGRWEETTIERGTGPTMPRIGNALRVWIVRKKGSGTVQGKKFGTRVQRGIETYRFPWVGRSRQEGLILKNGKKKKPEPVKEEVNNREHIETKMEGNPVYRLTHNRCILGLPKRGTTTAMGRISRRTVPGNLNEKGRVELGRACVSWGVWKGRGKREVWEELRSIRNDLTSNRSTTTKKK